MIDRKPGSWLSYAVRVALLAVTYVLAGRLGFTASAVHPVVSSAWPPSGIALAAMLLMGKRFWPGIALGAFAVNMSGGIHPLGAAGIALGNTLEALVGASLLTSFAGFRPTLERLRDVFGLLLAAAAGTPVSATIGTAILIVTGGAAGLSHGTIWLTWVTGDTIGILLIAPLALTWIAGPPPRVIAREVFEASVLGALLVVCTVVLFQMPFSYVYAIFPVTIWAAIRFGSRGAATASLVVSVLAIGYTLRDVGPFATSTPVNNLFQLQTFIGLLALTSLILAAVIAERGTAESALQRSRQKQHDIVHYASVGVIQTDRDGKILLANPALAHILGYEQPEELIGRNAVEMYWDPTQRAAVIARFQLQPDGTSNEVLWKRKDGSPIWIDAHGRYVEAGADDEPYFEGFLYDLTERKNLELQFRQAQKMEAVGRLAGGVAHDFNNILTVIASCTDFVLGDPTLAVGHRNDLGEVKRAADRATSLTRQLLAFGRTQVLRPCRIDLNDRLAELLPMLKRLFETTIDIRIETAPDIWAVRADPGQISQVLLNLAINARDAMPDGGVLTFATENCVVETNHTKLSQEDVIVPGDYVVLRVRDTGVGMDDDTQRKIFEPFFTTKEIGKGTGLGLATAYGIIKQSGGYIKVRTARGRGAEFLIYLPRTDAAPDALKPFVRRDDSPASGTVLLVEDEDGVRRALQRMLFAEGYTVLTATNGAEALDLFTARGNDVELLITDLVMPEMDGRELARQCCVLNDKLKVIFVSGYTRDSLLSRQTFDAGTEFIEKPFTSDVLLETIARVLRTERVAVAT